MDNLVDEFIGRRNSPTAYEIEREMIEHGRQAEQRPTSALIKRSTHHVRWTSDEDLVLRANSSSLEPRELASVLGRTENAILQRAARLGVIMHKIKGQRWSKEEDDLLMSLVGTITVHEISLRFRRTWKGVARRAKRLGLSVAFLRKNGTVTTMSETQLDEFEHQGGTRRSP